MALSVNSLRIGSGDECLLQARLPAGARATSDDSKPSVSNGSGDPRVAALRHVGAPLQRPAFEYRGGASVHAGAIADPAESTGKVRGTILLMPYDTGVNGDRRPSNEWVKRNTSLLVAEALEGEIIGGFRVAVAGLPSKYQHQPQRVSSLIAERDVDALTAHLSRLLVDDDLASAMSAAAVPHVATHFDIRNCTRRLEEFYDRITRH
mgnify:CR=1 FL=1